LVLIVAASARQLYLEECEFEVIGVDHVVMHAGLAEVRYTALQLGEGLFSLRRYQPQPAAA
jgi:general stress protein CsbA